MDWDGIEAQRIGDEVRLTLRTERDDVGNYRGVAEVLVRFRRDPDTSKPIVISVTVDTSQSGTALGPTDLRRLPWDRLLRAAETIFSTPVPDMFHAGGDWRDARNAYHQAWAEYHTSVQAAVAHPGRAGRDKSHYQQIAALYTGLLADGETKPIKRLAGDLGVSSNTVSGWVRRARSLGYLPKGTRGRAG